MPARSSVARGGSSSHPHVGACRCIAYEHPCRSGASRLNAYVANVAELSKTKTLTGGLVARCAPGLPFLLEEGMEVAFVPPRHDAPRRARVLSVQDAGRDAFLVTFEASTPSTSPSCWWGAAASYAAPICPKARWPPRPRRRRCYFRCGACGAGAQHRAQPAGPV